MILKKQSVAEFKNGVNDPEEAKLAHVLLFWREFFAGPDARVRCVQSSERELFNYTCKTFKLKSLPSVIVSDDPEFGEFITLDTDLLYRMLDNEHRLQQLVNRIHTELALGRGLNQLEKQLKSQEFWRTVRTVVSEAKSLFSVQVKADANS